MAYMYVCMYGDFVYVTVPLWHVVTWAFGGHFLEVVSSSTVFVLTGALLASCSNDQVSPLHTSLPLSVLS